MHPALFARGPADRHAFINNMQFLSVCRDFDFVDGNDGDYSENGAGRLPTFGAAARVVMEHIAAEGNFDFVVGAMAVELTASEAVTTFRDAVIEEGVE
jgi:hypothetical protein